MHLFSKKNLRPKHLNMIILQMMNFPKPKPKYPVRNQRHFNVHKVETTSYERPNDVYWLSFIDFADLPANFYTEL